MKLAVSHVKLAVGNTSAAVRAEKLQAQRQISSELVLFTSSTNRITGSLSADGVLKSLSKRLEACSGVAFCPVRSCRQYKNQQWVLFSIINSFIYKLKIKVSYVCWFFYDARSKLSHIGSVESIKALVFKCSTKTSTLYWNFHVQKFASYCTESRL